MDSYDYINGIYKKNYEIQSLIEIINRIIDYGNKLQIEYYRNNYAVNSITSYHGGYKNWMDFVIQMLKIPNNEYSNKLLLAFLENMNKNDENNFYNKIDFDINFLINARSWLQLR